MKGKLWDVLFWASMGITLLWLFLKLTGISNTPVWLEVGVPLAGVLVSVFTVYEKMVSRFHAGDLALLSFAMNLRTLNKEVKSIKQILLKNNAQQK